MNFKKILTFIGVIGSAILFAQEGNLIPNPGFEEELGKLWQVPNWVWKVEQGKRTFQPVIDDKVGHTGTKSYRFEENGEKVTAYLPMQDGKQIKLPDGVKDYTLTMWVKTEAKEPKANNVSRLELFANFYGKDKSVKPITLGLITAWEKTYPEWTKITKSITIPDGYTKATLTLKFTKGAKFSAVIWVDDLYFGPTATANTPIPAPAAAPAK